MKYSFVTPLLSIIIVHYKVEKEILACIDSLVKSKSKTIYEIIVVDNDETDKLRSVLKKKYSSVKYIKSESNAGFGAGNNIGAKAAKGEFLFFLNPDTQVFPKSIDALEDFLKKNKNVGIVSPLFLDQNNIPYEQGTRILNPIRAVFSLSFITKLFPNNSITKDYHLREWDRSSVKEIGVAPGTAFMIRKDLFNACGGFDEKFFLYFEEFDLCKRVKDSGKKIFIIPQAKVRHVGGASTKFRNDTNKIFKNSRFYYFKKHFGLIKALFVELFLRFDKYTLVLITALFSALVLSSYRLNEYMHFIGDQAWYYLSARDLALHKITPLVGIATSHPWLHQGAFWTYMLAPVLLIFQFNPLSGAYLTIVLFLVTIILLYRFAAEMFSKNVAIIAALLYATSPLIIMQTRVPYHTSPIPFFSLLFLYALYRWCRGNILYFPFVIFTLAILYNFEIATFLLTIVFLIIFIAGLRKKTQWAKNGFNKKIILLSILAFLIPMFPMLYYDIGHGFPQTVKFMIWLGYKIAEAFGYPSLHSESKVVNLQSVFIFLGASYQKLIYLPSSIVAFTIALLSFGYLFGSTFRRWKTKEYHPATFVLCLSLIIGVFGIILTKTISEAYLPVLFPVIILITAIFFDFLLRTRPASNKFIWLTIGLIVCVNGYSGLENNYFATKGYFFSDRISASKQIVSEADGRRYNLKGQGNGSQFESFIDTYKYLTWWLGNEPSDNKEKLQFIVTENTKGIKVTHND